MAKERIGMGGSKRFDRFLPNRLYGILMDAFSARKAGAADRSIVMNGSSIQCDRYLDPIWTIRLSFLKTDVLLA